VAERVATEGVMLQYAVDTKLDLCLSDVYEAVTKPPLPLNPYPRLLHILRAHAAKLDLFQASRSAIYSAQRCVKIYMHQHLSTALPHPQHSCTL
jgi:hypothetical protein